MYREYISELVVWIKQGWVSKRSFISAQYNPQLMDSKNHCWICAGTHYFKTQRTCIQIIGISYCFSKHRQMNQRQCNAVEGFVPVQRKRIITVMPWDWVYWLRSYGISGFKNNDETDCPPLDSSSNERGAGLATSSTVILLWKQENPGDIWQADAYEVYDADGKFLAIL